MSLTQLDFGSRSEQRDHAGEGEVGESQHGGASCCALVTSDPWDVEVRKPVRVDVASGTYNAPETSASDNTMF
jgi:hypothetical protein